VNGFPDGLRIGELAELGRVSTRAIRHYHRIGLLPEPPRQANGYRLYGPRDVVRLLRVRRLVEFGLSLDEAADVLADDEGRELRDILIDLDADLARQAQRIVGRRAQIAGLLEREGDLASSAEMSRLLGRLGRAAPEHPGLARERLVVEMYAVLALAMPGSAWVWVGAGVHLYALAWLAGLWASFPTRPHVLGDDALYARDGVFTEVVVPYTAIHGARVVRGSNLGRSGFKIDPERRAATLALGDTTVVLDLDPGVQPLVNGDRPPGPVATLAISVDRPQDFVQALARLRSPEREGSLPPPGPATSPSR